VILILKQCEREIAKFPEEIRGDIADALARLDVGENLSMPLAKPMPTIGKGVFELRLKDRSGQYRVIYALMIKNYIYILHAFKKTQRKTPHKNIELVKKRLKEIRI
jgi:phage-related protein